MPNDPAAAPRPVLLEGCGLTDPGRQRTENEDAFSADLDERLFIVADGMGGRSAGDVAAQLAVDELRTFYRERRADPRAPWPFPIDKTVSFGANLLRVGLKVVNQRIREAAAADPALFRMGATA